MKKIIIILLFTCISLQLKAQIKGTVTHNKKEPLPYVSIYFEHSTTGTSSNELGNYELQAASKGKQTIIFQFLGYKTLKKEIDITQFPFELDVVLEEENIQLNEVVINSKKNPANQIIKKTIENRKRYLQKITAFTSDFYSKGIFRIKNAPKKIFGQKIGDLGGGLDSTRSGVIYLSETVSKISFKQSDKFKERIIASKVSGSDNGFSFNQASDVNFNFYNNTIEIGDGIMISPIASYAFNYYRYKLLGTFYEGSHLINKIEITPKRTTDNAFTGIIYIVEDHWAIYGFDVSVTGKQMGQPVLDALTLKHGYTYTENEDYWSLISQLITFKFGMLGINVDGQFTTAYSNYIFNPEFKKKEFTNEILSFTENSNKKDSTYWDTARPVLLTQEEIKDYKIKDSIQVRKKSKKYLDSIDTKHNKFKPGNALFGYTYRNSHKNWSLNFSSALMATQFNTVQGWNPSMDISYNKFDKDNGSRFRIGTNLSYGFSYKKFRINGTASYLFNGISKPYLKISGGKKISQFNNNSPISPTLNSLATLFFEDNYGKFYEKSFAEIQFSNEVRNGIRINAKMAYENRSPLVNTTNYVTINTKNKIYTANDPLNETFYGVPSFDKHTVYSFGASARIRFNQKYISLPNRKVDVFTSNYPTLTLAYDQNFASGNSKYNFGKLTASLQQKFTLENKGAFSYSVHSGTFFNAKEIAFIDYNHFNGNQTHIGSGDTYTNVFNLMPYYIFSTNQSFAELHTEHHFKGFILNKIPLFNKLGLHLILGGHSLLTKDNKPYSEFSIGLDNIGFGKLRFLRLDYVKSLHSGITQNGFVFGIKL